MSSSIGLRVKELRSYLKLTQVQFAKNLGVKGGVVSAWEKGAAPLPYGRLLVICDAYGVNESWLSKGEGDMFDSRLQKNSHSGYESAIDFAASIICDLPSEKRESALGFIRELLKRCEIEAAIESQRVRREVEPDQTDEDEVEDDGEERLEIASAEDDFDDDDYEEFDLEEDYDD